MKNKKYFDFSKEVIPQYLNRIMSHETKSFYIDIGTPKNLKKTKNILMKNIIKKIIKIILDSYFLYKYFFYHPLIYTSKFIPYISKKMIEKKNK